MSKVLLTGSVIGFPLYVLPKNFGSDSSTNASSPISTGFRIQGSGVGVTDWGFVVRVLAMDDS